MAVKTDLPNLDLLRSIAVTLVVGDHFTKSLGFTNLGAWSVESIGLFGVYLFFVHTSLVLMWSLERRPNPLDFYVRRIFRIYPLAIVTILIAALTHAPVAGIYGQYFHAWNWTPKELLWNLLLVHGTIGIAPIIYGVTWSLPPEIYMYILLPGLFFYARSQRKRWPIVIIFVLAAMVGKRMSPLSNGNNFTILIPDFLAGVIAYVSYMRRRTVIAAWVLPLLIVGLLAFNMRFQSFRSDWIACLILGLALPWFRETQVFVIPAKIIARYSYGIYLTHPFAIVIAVHTLHLPLAGQIAVMVSLTAALSVIAYHSLERPMMSLGARVAMRLARERHPASIAPALDPAP